MLDKVKLVFALLLVAAGVVGFYYWADEVALLYRVLGLLAVVLASLGVASQTEMGHGALSFGRDAYVEARKVVWPTRKETVQTTGLVLVMVTLIGIILWLFDMLLLTAVKWLTGQGG
ncbi:MAG: preprotein translocase subunit SecE [Pseudomonadota bacterium]|nr:MAG: preprotein translocase subunit SecE [Pseudomonadota bacterium]